MQAAASPSIAQIDDGSPFLLAVLANPPLGAESRTLGRVRLAARILGFEQMRIANLFAIASASSRDIAVLGHDVHGWEIARPPLLEAIVAAEQVLIGFGTIPVTGAARRNFEEQLRWLAEVLHLQGHDMVWQVGQARHPSRWHQYVSDRHGRTSGGSFDERLREVLVSTETAALSWGLHRPPARSVDRRG
ncbi:MAG: hypothetical protein ACK5IN_04055 [Microbacterium sp.]|uniref:hypothetical protein n=1 Tax=Microbacterium sp. TaxID=51671 RepID=UPI003A8B9AE5